LTLTPESISADMSRRAITIDLSKAVFVPGATDGPPDSPRLVGAEEGPRPPQPTGNPDQASPDPNRPENVADVKAAAMRYLVAFGTGDVATAEAASIGMSPNDLAATIDAIASKRDIDTAVWARFASPGQEKPITMLSPQELKDKLQIVDVRINGETATARRADGAGQVMTLKCDQGQWKVDNSGLYRLYSARKLQIGLLEARAAAAANREVARELGDGKYSSAADAGAAVRSKARAALDADADYQKLTAEEVAGQPRPSGKAGGADADATEGRTALAGGEGGSKVAPAASNGNPVLGFRYVFGNWAGHQVFRTFDPLFESPAPGTAAAIATGTQTVLARAGYVVGGLVVASDAVSPVAIRVMFVHWNDGKIDATDSYSSPWIGEPGSAHQQQLAGTGEKVIGTFGRKGLNVNAIGLLIAPAAGQAPAR
jgi:hypothetical protein